MTITLTGDRVPQIVTTSLSLFRAVNAGRWGAAVDVCPENFKDADAARTELDSLAVEPFDLEPWPDPVIEGARVSVDMGAAVLRSALNMYVRVLLGQFGEVAWATGNGALADACSMVRAAHQRSGAWPEHPRSSWSVAGTRAPRDAQIAYDAWKLLGGGVLDRPLLTGAVTLS